MNKIKKGILTVSISRTDDPKCVICGKSLGEHVLCYTLNSVQITSIPLCATCLRKGVALLEEQETVNKEKERQTNDQWFSSLSTFEKAKWFCDHITCSDCRFNKQCLDEDMGCKLWQKWLLEEHP